MISRVTMRKSGLAKYLRDGLRSDSSYNRLDKDRVIPLYGSLDNLENAEKYTNKYKDWSYNYEHITISFSKEDMNRLDLLDDYKRDEALKDMATMMIKHRTCGYDIDNEVIAYSEVHQPKIKKEFNKERLEHIHIGISYLNPLNNTKLKTTFYNNSYISDTIDKYIAMKHDITAVIPYRKKTNPNNKWGAIRKKLINDCKSIFNEDDLIKYLKDNNYTFEKRKDKYTVLPKGMNVINIRSKKDFPTIEAFMNPKAKDNNNYLEELRSKSLEDYKAILSKYYNDRFKMIDDRRSVNTKEALKDIYKDTKEDNSKDINILSMSYQQKIFYKHYKHLIKDDLRGYYIDIKKDDEVIITNKKKDISIVDKGDKVISEYNDNLVDKVKLMIDVAEAKGWNINTISIEGSEEFKIEVNKQIVERLELVKSTKQKEIQKEIIKTTIQRPTTPTQNLKLEHDNKQQLKDIDKDISMDNLKMSLNANRVLDYAIDKYKLDKEHYEITGDNKINNKNNKQKPKNVIDFMQKECKLNTKESIDICKDLYINQPININDEKDIKTMPLKISICEDNNINALNKWKVKEVNNYTELATLMKQYPYSSAEYDKSYRNSSNANSFNNILIYDIDNDKGQPQLNIKEAQEILKKHNISAMILPSKSNNKDKNGHIAERYRIVIPTKQSINSDIDKDTYREFQFITAKALNIDKYVDKKALNDKARFYYKSPVSAEPIIIKSDKVMNIDNLQDRAIENIKNKKIEQELEHKKIEQLQKQVQEYKVTQQQSSNNLTYADTQKIINLDIKTLIKKEESATEYKEGNYTMLKSTGAKYSIVDNLAHDFKSDTTYNSITYLQKQYNTTNLNKIARELQNKTNDSFTKINYKAIETAVNQARYTATNDKTFEDSIKNHFGVKYCKLDKDTLTIADQEIKLQKINIEKKEIINSLKQNRATEQQANNQGMTR